MAAQGDIQDLVLSCKSKSKILSWNVAVGDQVKKDSVLCTYVFTEKVTDPNNFIVNRKLKAKCPGCITEITVEPEQEVQRGQVVARLKEAACQHNTVIKDMCVDCGADLRREPGIPGELSEPVTASIPAVHNILELKVSVEEALRLARYDEEQLLKARKLVLVVDLDMTLIHTTVQHVPKGTKDVFSFTLPGHQYEYHTKLRPNARKFLESISKFFELHIFTMGSRMYAHTVAKCLDPDGKFFAHRIRSRDEFINSFSKFHDLKALFPCGDHMVCIIDDREDVWSYAPNLIVVKPYKIFKGSDDINDPFKPELTLTDSFGVNGKQPSAAVVETKVDDPKPEEAETSPETSEEKKATEEKVSDAKGEEGSETTTNTATSATTTSPSKETPIEPPKEEVPQQHMTRSFFINAKADLDDNLYHVDKVLRRVHCKFYSVVDALKAKGDSVRKTSRVAKFCSPKTLKPDVRVIVPRIRKQILKGCNIVFTGVIPRNVKLEKSKLWKTAVSLGARVHSEIIPKTDIHPGTTHVIAARHGTKKSFDAYQSPDIHLVHPSWLACSKEKWKRPLEDLFPVPVEPIEEEIFLDQQKDSSDDKYTPFPVELKQKSVLFQSSLPLPLPLPEIELEEDMESEASDNMIDFSMDNFSVIPSSEELDGMHKEIEDLLHNSSMDSNGSLDLDLEGVISNGDLSKTRSPSKVRASAERDSPIEKKSRKMTFSSIDIEKRGLSRLRLNSTNSDR